MMIAILVIASVNLAFFVIVAGFLVDFWPDIYVAGHLARLNREETAAFKAEVLHHINHLTVRKRPAERAKEQGQTDFRRPSIRAAEQNGD